MYLKINKKKLEIVELSTFSQKLKGIKFLLEPIDYAIKFPNRKWITTVFLCQRVDIVMTDKDENIKRIYKNVKSEKYFFPKLKVSNIYFLPLKTAQDLKIGEKLKITNN